MAAYGTATGAEPPEAQSIRSMLHIVRILAIIIGVLLFLAGLAWIAVIAAAASTCGAAGLGAYCGAAFGAALTFPILVVIWGVVAVIIYTQMKKIEAMVNARQYEEAKHKTLVWMIIGFILGGILVGVLLLIAYIKFDPLISWQRNAGAAAANPSAGAPPPAAAAAGAERFCPSCGASNPRSSGFCAKCGKALPAA